EELRTHDPYLYFHGVALNVWREEQRQPGTLPLEEAVAELAADGPNADHLRNEHWLQCLEGCLERLPPASRQGLDSYHRGVRRAKIRAREQLAAMLRIPLNALRIRVYRLRSGLRECVMACIERRSAMKDS